MSDSYYINALLKSLDLFDICGSSIKFINIFSSLDDIPYPHCGCINRHESKGIRKIFLTHKSNGDMKTILEVSHKRYQCKDCHHYFKEHIPLLFVLHH